VNADLRATAVPLARWAIGGWGLSSVATRQPGSLLDRREARRADPQGRRDAPATEPKPTSAQDEGGELVRDIAAGPLIAGNLHARVGHTLSVVAPTAARS
jgi:hypothetical protein